MSMPEVFEYGGYGVNVKLTEMRTTKDVVWVRGNSFVVVENKERGPFVLPNGDRVDLVSVNGIGEVRWPVWSRAASSRFPAATAWSTSARWMTTGAGFAACSCTTSATVASTW